MRTNSGPEPGTTTGFSQGRFFSAHEHCCVNETYSSLSFKFRSFGDFSVSLSLLSCGCLTSSTRCFHPGGAAASKPSKQTASSQSPSSSSSPRHRLWISLCVSLFNFLHPREPLCNLHNYRPITSYSVICLNTMSAGELTLQWAQLYCMLVGFS